MLRIIISFIFVLTLSIPAAYAQGLAKDKAMKVEQVPTLNALTPDLSSLKHTKSGRVDKVIDGLTIMLKDKSIIRLASLDIPDFHIWRNAPYSEKALATLSELLPVGTQIKLYQTRKAKQGRINRMNHALGHIITKDGEIWAQGVLLASGLARVYIAPNAPELTSEMMTLEAKARSKKQGFWEDESDFIILTPETADKAIGDLAIIEGDVAKTAVVKNNLYLNFGQNWRDDFTIVIKPAMRKKLAQRGIDTLNLSHSKVRVRGWVENYNGPSIELEAPEHLEILTRESGVAKTK